MPSALPGFWQASLGPAPVRPCLVVDAAADVCIVGAGYTGLWTAWALLAAEPTLRVILVEAESAGFGASGRNGGWLSALMPGNRTKMASGPAGREGVLAFQRHLVSAVESVLSVCVTEGIDAQVRLGGTLTVATDRAQEARLRATHREDEGWGVESFWLAGRDATDRVRVAGARAATWNPHCARIQPAALARGLARVVESRGALIYERTRATSVRAGRVETAAGPAVSAPWVVVATEGYTGGLGHRRLIPLNSSMIVTRPLPPAVWDEIGWSGAETVADAAHVYVYLQRTADDRIAIGGRGVPYRFGSRVDPAGGCPPATVAQLRSRLIGLFPVLGRPAVTGYSPESLVEAGWSGVLGVARDWCPAITVERGDAGGTGGAGGGTAGTAGTGGAGGVVTAGGYVGDGVATSHLAGTTVADLVLGVDSELTHLPWVGWRARRWEPEPLRWLGVRTVHALYRRADRIEAGRPDEERPSVLAGAAGRLSGR